MSDAPILSPEVSWSVLTLARTPVADASSGQILSFDVTRDPLSARRHPVDHGQEEGAMLINRREPARRGDLTWAVEAVDPEAAGIDPLKYV